MQETLDSKKMIILQNGDEAQIVLEYNEEWAAVHIHENTKVTKTLYRWMVEQAPKLNDFVNTMGCGPLMAACFNDDEPIKRLAKKSGFTYIRDHGPYSVFVFGDIE